jgi:hypothetical protein
MSNTFGGDICRFYALYTCDFMLYSEPTVPPIETGLSTEPMGPNTIHTFVPVTEGTYKVVNSTWRALYTIPAT